jgi:hypothetical protein
MKASKYLLFLLIILIGRCADNKNDIAEKRENVNKDPVASYVIPMGDPKLDRKFGVQIFETPFTFKYLLMMFHDGTEQQDTLYIPNIGISPVIQIKPGNDTLSCIIGFLDKEKVFREYKMLTGTNDQLRLTTLKKYSLGSN